MATMQGDPMGMMGAKQIPNLDGVVPATPQEVEEFLIMNPVAEEAQTSFRKMDPKGQRMVINRGVMQGARDATAAFIGRMNSVRKIITGGVQLAPGDWLCPVCGDVQFGRNASCRRCGIAKPTSVPDPQTAMATQAQMQMPQMQMTMPQMGM